MSFRGWAPPGPAGDLTATLQRSPDNLAASHETTRAYTVPRLTPSAFGDSVRFFLFSHSNTVYLSLCLTYSRREMADDSTCSTDPITLSPITNTSSSQSHRRRHIYLLEHSSCSIRTIRTLRLRKSSGTSENFQWRH